MRGLSRGGENIMEERLNQMVFWNEIIRVLEKEKKEIENRKAKRYTEEYFEKFKNNPFEEYGIVSIALEQAKECRQAYNDLVRDAISNDVNNMEKEQ